jgi:hypothetical protein
MIFLFADDSKSFRRAGAFLARVPSGVDSKTALLTTLAGRLELPGWFGHNWDALEECLRDLSWIEEREVVLVHEDLPAIEDLDTYLQVLHSAADDWREGDDHALLVVFPREHKDAIESALHS